MVEIWSSSRGNGHPVMVYRLLHDNPEVGVEKGCSPGGGNSTVARVPTGRVEVVEEEVGE
jgi:hypothetical protein